MANTKTNGKSIKLRCPKGHILSASNVVFGTKVRCIHKGCGEKFTITEEFVLRSTRKKRASRRLLPKRTRIGDVSQDKAEPDDEQSKLHPYSLDKHLYYLGENDPVDGRDMTQHAICIGRTGSGKTSTVVPLFLHSLLNPDGHNAGGFLYCFKNSDRATYLKIIEEAGRSASVVIIDLFSGHVINFLELERKAIGEEAANSGVEMFNSLLRLADQGRSGGDSDPFWRLAAGTGARYCIFAHLLADLPVSLLSISRMLNSIPHEDELLDDEFLEQSYCVYVMNRAHERLEAGELSESEEHTYNMLGEYFYLEMNRLHLRTKGSITGQFTNTAAPFCTGRFRQLFNGEEEENAVNFADAWEKGTIFLVDINQEKYQEIGRLATAIIRRQVIRTCQRRVINDLETDRMAFTLQDEYPRVADPAFDEIALATMREKKISILNLMQNVDQLVDVCGSREKADALLQNHYLKFMLANDGSTARWNSELISKRWSMLEYSGVPLSGAGGGNAGGSKAQVEWLLPHEWHNLKTGGKRDGNVVECIVFKSGRSFSSGLPYQHIELQQGPMHKQAKGD